MAQRIPRHWQNEGGSGLWKEVSAHMSHHLLDGLQLETPVDMPELWGWLESTIHLVQRARGIGEPSRFDALSYWYWGDFAEGGETTTPGLLHGHMWDFSARLQEVTKQVDPQFSAYLKVIHSVAVSESGIRDGICFLTYAADLISKTNSNYWEILLRPSRGSDELQTLALFTSIERFEEALRRCEGHLQEAHLGSLKQIARSLKSQATGERSALSLIRDQIAHGKASFNYDGSLSLDVQLQLLIRARTGGTTPGLVRGMDPDHVEHLFRMMNAFGVVFYGAAETARFHWARSGKTRGPPPPAEHARIAEAQIRRTIPEAP